MTDQLDRFGLFVFRVAVSHVMAYSIAGIYALTFINYAYVYSVPPLSHFMRQLDSPWVAAGPTLQIIRGIVMALALWLVRKPLLQGKWGWAKLALLLVGLSYIATIAPGPGSFDGYIFTTFPLSTHTLGIPEMLIYVLVFSVFLYYWYQTEKKLLTVIALVMLVVIIITGVLGVLAALGRLPAP